jgi:hypothetical protein
MRTSTKPTSKNARDTVHAQMPSSAARHALAAGEIRYARQLGDVGAAAVDADVVGGRLRHPLLRSGREHA